MSDYTCNAAKFDYQNRLVGPCGQGQKIEINKKKLCLRHAQQEALALMIKSGKAKQIFVPVVIKTPGEEVLTYDEALKRKLKTEGEST